MPVSKYFDWPDFVLMEALNEAKESMAVILKSYFVPLVLDRRPHDIRSNEIKFRQSRQESST